MDPQTDQAPPLTTEDYQQLHSMLLSDDADVRAQGLGLAHKLTPTEQQTFFDLQKTANAGKGERTRVDSSVGGLPPELAAVSGVSLARAVAAPAATMGARAVAGATNALGQAAPLVKYELTKSTLEHLGVPGPAAMAAAIMVSGYKTGAKAASSEAAAADTAAASAPATKAPLSDLEFARQETAAGRFNPKTLAAMERRAAATPTPPPAPPVAVPPQAPGTAGTPPSGTSQFFNVPGETGATRPPIAVAPETAAATPVVAASGKMRLTLPEWLEFQRLVKGGASLEKAEAGAKASGAMARQFGLSQPTLEQTQFPKASRGK